MVMWTQYQAGLLEGLCSCDKGVLVSCVQTR